MFQVRLMCSRGPGFLRAKAVSETAAIMRRLLPLFCLFLALGAGMTKATVADEVRGLLRLDGRHVKWGDSAYGRGAEVTFAYLVNDRVFPHARNCGVMTPLDRLLGKSRLAPAAFHREVVEAFALWSEEANIRFRYVDDAERADIVIGALSKPRGIAFTNVVQETRGAGQIDRIAKAMICLDPSERWEIGRDGDFETYNVRRVVAHEIGHALGLGHLGSDGGLMGFEYPEPQIGPLARLEHADREAIVHLYGRHDGQPVLAAAAEPWVGPAAPPCETRIMAQSKTLVECALVSRPLPGGD